MSKNWLFIENGIVNEIVTQDDTPNPSQATKPYDTLAQDDSQTFQIGDTFTAELQLQYNKSIWQSMRWLPTDAELAEQVINRKKFPMFKLTSSK